MPIDDREKQFERALAGHFRSGFPDSACPDAEILAAYHERTLSAEEMARWKDHISACMRCQESLALVEQSEDVRLEEWEGENVPLPVENLAQVHRTRAASAGIHREEEVYSAQPSATPPISKLRARPRWHWIVPLGALAASVFAWVGVREFHMWQNLSPEDVQVAQNRQTAPGSPTAAYEATDQLKKAEPPATKPSESLRLRSPIPGASAKIENPKVKEPLSRPSPPPPPAKGSEAGKQKDLGFSAPDEFAPRTPAPPMPRDLAKSRDERAAASSAANTIAPAGAAVGGVAANRPTEEKMKAPVPEAAETVEVQAEAVPSKASRLDMRRRATPNLVRQANEDRSYILAPGERHAWRVGQVGKIEASVDQGVTWTVQKSGVLADLTTGSAPSAKVCWVVGRAGTVLLTTDGGKHWKQVSSPVTEELGGVHATDALHASIWDVSNRASFETGDGGATWKRISNE